jgi:hypothetical protein
MGPILRKSEAHQGAQYDLEILVYICALECSSIMMPYHLFYIPLLVLVVPNIRNGRFRAKLDLRDRLTTAEEVEDVIWVRVGDLVVLVAWTLEVLEVVEEAAGPDVDSSVSAERCEYGLKVSMAGKVLPLVVLVPGFAVFRPDALLLTLSTDEKVWLVGKRTFLCHASIYRLS